MTMTNITLKLGSKGSEVERLQNFLGIVSDGDFGPKTEKALKEWQAKNGLKSDGVAGKDTLTKMGVFFETKPVSSSSLEIEKLKGKIPENVLSQIPEVAKKFNITSKLRLAHFLAQCAHESGNFKAVFENLNYSAKGLKNTFGKYFPGNLNESYAHQPERIAARVYGGRLGNGDESTKEGWKYRGRGYIQLTGKANYAVFDKFVDEDIVANPDLVATKYPMMSAAFFFDKNGLWKVCDAGSSVEDVTAVTKRVNGGTLGLADRIKKFNEYYSLLK